MTGPDPIPLSLYVHLPWCVKKCPYCDFNSHAARGPLPLDPYLSALLADLDADRALTAGRTVDTVFIGGGTPSLFPPAAIARLIDGIAARLTLASDAELTLEANPGTIERGRFAGYRAAGVNRVSVGVQSFDDAALARIGRIHRADEARRALCEAQDAGLDNVNIDLMYALPDQSLEAAVADVEAALRFGPAHVSHYQLTLEPNTEFAVRPPSLPDDEAAWAMQAHGQQRLAAAGFARYEVSAWAREGRRCRHNLGYWTFGDYLGIGAGAHGKITLADGTVLRTRKAMLPQRYIARAAAGAALGTREPVPAGELPFEFMLNALRLEHGVEAALFSRRTGLDGAALEPALSRARARGWLVPDAARLEPTELGRRFLNDVIAAFLPRRPRGAHAPARPPAAARPRPTAVRR